MKLFGIIGAAVVAALAAPMAPQAPSPILPLPYSEKRAAGRGGGGAAIADAPNDPPQPFTWQDTTLVANAGWGRMTALTGGKRDPTPRRWIGVCTLFPRPNSILRLLRSDDGARTWKAIATVTEPGRNLDNGELLELPNGDILLTGRSVVEGHQAGDSLSYHLPVYRSKDGGVTWTFVSQIETSEPAPFEAGRPSLGLWEPHLFQLPDGRVACQYANEKHSLDKPLAYSQVVSEKVSPDGGATWGPEIVVAAQIGGGGQRPGMPVVTRLPSGAYYAVYEVVGIGNADVYGKTSLDGVTWSTGIGDPIPDQHAGPFVTCLADGRLVVTSCSNRISVSGDSGHTWRETTAAFPDLGQVFSWPAIYQTAPDTIAVMTTRRSVTIRWGRIAPPAP